MFFGVTDNAYRNVTWKLEYVPLPKRGTLYVVIQPNSNNSTNFNLFFVQLHQISQNQMDRCLSMSYHSGKQQIKSNILHK